MNKILVIFLIVSFMFKQIIFANTDSNTYINSSNIIYDEKNNIVQLAENSKININETNILVDRGIIDYNKDEIKVFGNFYLYQEFNILSGKDLIGNTKLTHFEASNVSYIYNNDLKIDSINAKRDDNIFTFYDNFLTPCELEGYFNCPTWSLRIDKTEYDIVKDKFIHFDTFLQIADYKLFYLPYFSHYGVKAPRQKGFLPPTIEFVIGGDSGIKTPYYLPIKQNTEVTLTPTWLFNESFQFLENYSLNTEVISKFSGGEAALVIDNIKKEKSENINTSVKFNTTQVLNKDMIFSAKGLFTNSISTTRSINEEPITFEDIYLKIENYNFLSKKDYLRSEISTVESFEASSDISKIPISPNISYYNYFDKFNDFSLVTNVMYRILDRDSSTNDNPSENHIFNLNNQFLINNNFDKINTFNKVTSLNSINSYKFDHNPSLNRDENVNSMIFSSDIFFNFNKNIKPRLKFIHFEELNVSDSVINEDSNSISFNYINQFADNRFYGNDLNDNSSRIVYGLENNLKFLGRNIQLNMNQSYDFSKNSKYLDRINQSTNLSDYALEFKTNYKKANFNLDLRIDENTLSKKEMNYSFEIKNPVNFILTYHETDSKSYKDVSSDSKNLLFEVSKTLNDNFEILYTSNLDLKNNYSPYSDKIIFSFYDECSKLNITYKNTRYNDNHNTNPEEKVSLTFHMDYLGFFGYEQTTDLFFEEPGSFDYGL